MNETSNLRERLQLGLTVAGVGVAAYLTYVKLFGLEAYCGGVGNCEAVQTSPYAELFGIPVAIFGLAAYVALIGLWWVKRSDWKGLGDWAVYGFFFAALIGVLFSAYLTYLELFVILAICPWCVASAVIMTGLFLLSLWEVAGGSKYEEEMLAESVPVRADD